MSDKIKIDPNRFALAVVSGSQLEKKDDTKASKDALKRYLTAYYLIEKFNKLEAKQFSILNDPDFVRMLNAIGTSNVDENYL